MRTPLSWFVVLALVNLIAPYALGARPRTPRDWRAITVTIGFLTWLLLGFVSVRA